MIQSFLLQLNGLDKGEMKNLKEMKMLVSTYPIENKTRKRNLIENRLIGEIKSK